MVLDFIGRTPLSFLNNLQIVGNAGMLWHLKSSCREQECLMFDLLQRLKLPLSSLTIVKTAFLRFES